MKQQFEEEQFDLNNVGTDWQPPHLDEAFTSPTKMGACTQADEHWEVLDHRQQE